MLCLSLSVLFGCSNLIMHFSINFLRFYVGVASGFFQCEIVALNKGLLYLCLTLFVPHFSVSALCLKCTEHVDHNSCVVQ